MERKKIDNAGFTVVELVVSFTITLVVILLLFQIVLNLKDLYTKDGVRTELLIKQGLMVKSIADSFEEQEVTKVAKCTEDNCYRFTFADNKTRDLKYDPDNNTFQYGDYKTKLVDGSSFGTIKVTKATYKGVDADDKDSILTIYLPVSNALIDGEYGVKISLLYNSLNTTVTGI